MEVLLLLLAALGLVFGGMDHSGHSDHSDHSAPYEVVDVTTKKCVANLDMAAGAYRAQDGQDVHVSDQELRHGHVTYTCQKMFSGNVFVFTSDHPTAVGVQCWRISVKALGIYLIEQMTRGTVSVDPEHANQSEVCNDPRPGPQARWAIVKSTRNHVAGAFCMPKLQQTYFGFETQSLTAHHMENDIWGCQGSNLDSCQALRSMRFLADECPTMRDFLNPPNPNNRTSAVSLSCVAHFHSGDSDYQLLYDSGNSNMYCMALAGNRKLSATLRRGTCAPTQTGSVVSGSALRLQLTSKHHKSCMFSAASDVIFSLPLLLLATVTSQL